MSRTRSVALRLFFILWIHMKNTKCSAVLGGSMKSCIIWSTSGPVVQRGSSFQVYCTFACSCDGAMYSDHPPKQLRDTKLNSTTIFVNVSNITKNITYSCQCKCAPELDPCGLDISAGYLPELPKNVSCIYEIKDNQSGVVFCTWSSGRDTFLWNHSVLWVMPISKNHTDGPAGYEGSTKEAGLSSASFTALGSVQSISVQVEVRNPLGSKKTPVIHYQLTDIALPSTPVLGSPSCSSRRCIIEVNQSVWTQLLEIQFRAEPHNWTASPDQVVQTGPVQRRSVSSLEPFTFYQFRARSRLSLWSRWSANVSSWTQEEAPAKELDVWSAEAASDFKSLRVYWKPLSVSSARGRILRYGLAVTSRKSGPTFISNVTANVSNVVVKFCEDCEVSVWAINSKGTSPRATITAPHRKAKPHEVLPPQDVHATACHHGVCVSWRRPDSSPLLAAYVVEWYREGNKMEELQWVRLGRDDNHTVVTGLKPFECYEGAVHAVSNRSSVSSSSFTGVSTEASAPSAAPSVQETGVEGNRVTVTWRAPPRDERRGCLTNYTIYLEMNSTPLAPVSVPAAHTMYVSGYLSPARYSLWMTASTAGGEGRAGEKVHFSIQQESRLAPVVLCAVVGPVLVLLVCLYHSSAVKQRLRLFFQCLVLDVVPDPANSRWAKDSLHGKGNINLQLQLSDSGVTEEEEEPHLVDVEELLLHAPLSCTETELLHPQTNYIKSFSHDSDSSAHTQASLDSTVEYISSHGPGHMEEDDNQELFAGMTGFFPSHNLLTEPMEFGGKLTLNAVRIDCSDFLLSEA